MCLVSYLTPCISFFNTGLSDSAIRPMIIGTKVKIKKNILTREECAKLIADANNFEYDMLKKDTANQSLESSKDILDQNNLQYDVKKEPAEDYALWVTLLQYGKLCNLQEVLLYYRVYEGQVSQKRGGLQLKSKLLKF